MNILLKDLMGQSSEEVLISLPDISCHHLSSFFNGVFKHEFRVSVEIIDLLKMSIFKFEPMTDEEYEKEILKNDNFEVIDNFKNDEFDDQEMNMEEPDKGIDENHSNIIKKEKVQITFKKIETEDLEASSDFKVPFKYKCTVCDYKTQYLNNMKRHGLKHNKVKIKHESCLRQCSKCEYRTKWKSNLNKHYERVHVQDKNFPCPTCGKIFKKQTLLEKHMKNAHALHKCTHCDYQSNYKSGLKKHIEFVHEKTAENGFEKCSKCYKRLLPDQMESHVCELYSCEICGKQFSSTSGLGLHKSDVHEDHDLKCEQCGKTFDRLLSFKFHVANAHDKVPCHICGKKFGKKALSDHLTRTHKPKETCKLCGKEVRLMKKHINDVHTPDRNKSFTCQECGKGFFGSHALQRHQMNVHLRLRPYKCRYGCSFASSYSCHRNRHEKKSHGSIFQKNGLCHKDSK